MEVTPSHPVMPILPLAAKQPSTVTGRGAAIGRCLVPVGPIVLLLVLAMGLTLMVFWAQAATALAAQPVPEPAIRAAGLRTAAPLALTNGTIITEDISIDTTWRKTGSPYYVTRLGFQVWSSATLTIEPGVEVVAADDLWIFVAGSLVAQGTESEPILFTSANKQPGQWYGLYVNGWAEQPAVAVLDHVTVEYAGKYGGALEALYATITVNHSTFRYSTGHGIASYFTGQVQVSDSNFVGNADYALNFSSYAEHDPLLSNLTATGNGRDAVGYGGVHILGAHTLEATGIPYVLYGGFTVEHGSSLTIEPDVEMQMDGGFWVWGELDAIGSAGAPVRFTGLEKTPGSWAGISVGGDGSGTLASAVFDHVILEYGGEKWSDYSANLTVASSVVTVTNSIVRDGGSHGIHDTGGVPGEGHSLYIADTGITGNGGAAILCDDESADPALARLSVSGNGSDAILLRYAGAAGQHVWENVGVPYIVDSHYSVWDEGSLVVEPGVEVRFSQGANLSVAGNLYALGTPSQPITFAGTEPQAGWWGAIYSDSWGTPVLELRHCDIGFGGNSGSGMIQLGVSTAIVQNCRIHDSADDGIEVILNAQPLIRGNRIENNSFGLLVQPSGTDPYVLDARGNWWGDPSGPTHPSNPAGTGDAVSDYVLFDPWLTSPEQAAPLLHVRLAGPLRFAPGATERYAVLYDNATDQPVQDAVIRVLLPGQARYLDSKGGIYWSARHEVFWRLGTLPAGTGGVLSFRLQFEWGLEEGSKATTLAQLSGSVLDAAEFDVAPYLTYVPVTLISETELTAGQVDAERLAYPEVDQAFLQAMGEGYVFGYAANRLLSDGSSVNRFVLVRFQPQFSAIFIWRKDANVSVIEVNGSSLSVHGQGQIVRYDRQTGTWTELGDSGARLPGDYDLQGAYLECMRQCIAEKLPGQIAEQLIKGLSSVSNGWACIKALLGDEDAILGCAKGLASDIPGVEVGVELGECNSDCQDCTGDCDDVRCHCCKSDKRFCDSGDQIYGTFGGSDVIKLRKCSPVTKRYLATVVERICALCDKCVDNGGSPICVAKRAQLQSATTARLDAGSSASDLSCDECRAAKDPNELYGPEGDLVPGQLLTYTIAYENVGPGDAFDVFIVDSLGPEFDASTLSLPGSASFSPGSRSIFWMVGDLAPYEEPGSSGLVSFTVRLKGDLPSGTLVSNQAEVHFPSVPEVTPTNAVVNLVQSLAAVPLEVHTTAGEAVSFTLSGRQAGSGTLSYEVVKGPLYGMLGGIAPTLTYTPSAVFSGLDRLLFAVSDGVTTSLPAEVSILVGPSSSDSTPPVVAWTAPAAGETILLGGLLPIAGPNGLIYPPLIQVQFSEPMSRASITATSVQLRRAGGEALAVEVSYDRTVHQALILPKEPLQPQSEYTITVLPGVEDLAGNPLAAAVHVTFATGDWGRSSFQVYLPLVMRNR